MFVCGSRFLLPLIDLITNLHYYSKSVYSTFSRSHCDFKVPHSSPSKQTHVFYCCHLVPPRMTQLKDFRIRGHSSNTAGPLPPGGLGSHPIPIPRSGRVTPGSREEMLRTKGDTKERLKIIIGCKLSNIAGDKGTDGLFLSMY